MFRIDKQSNEVYLIQESTSDNFKYDTENSVFVYASETRGVLSIYQSNYIDNNGG